MDASTVDAVVDALRALLEDPAFRRLDGSFAAAFEDEHASTARERFEAYARELKQQILEQHLLGSDVALLGG